MTTPLRRQEIDRIIAAVLEREPAERAAFLDEACAGDEQLRREIDSLLTHDRPERPGAPVEEATQLFAQPPGALGIEKIGRYQIVRALGAGGMGQVYLGRDEQLNRSVAVKLLSDYRAAEDERMSRFRQEALSASALNHPNILTIYEIGASGSTNFIATEFVDGLTLSERIELGRISVDETLSIAQQIAGALTAAHAAGIIHRDIKSANIMVRADGLVKVLDFGIAKYEQPENALDSKKALVETLPGAVMGTAAYMSPEQARGLPVDVRSDIWSLGVVVYEMIAGRRPFLGDTAMDVMSAVLERQPERLSASGFEGPDSLERIVFKALQKDRNARYSSANEMLADLKDVSRKLDFAAETERNSADHKPAETRAGKSSIAVLPFVNMSTDSENDYFCDGLSEELLNALTRIDDLNVAPRTSSFSFRGKDANVSVIGAALKVSSVLEGSVRKSANRLRIAVQLINTADGYNLWSGQYDRELKDVFDVQDEIALAVVDALKVKLLGREKAAVLKRSTDNVEAYQLLLKGRYHWYKQMPESVRKSRDYFQQAIELDPAYAPGYAGLSEYYGLSSALGMMPGSEGWPLAEAAMMKAQELDDTLPEIHNGLAAIRMFYYRDWHGAEREIKRTVELNPKFAEVHCLHSYCLVAMGRLDDALAQARRACEIDPLSITYNRYLGTWLYYARDYDEAITQFHQALDLDPNNAPAHEDLGQVFHQTGQHQQAIAEWQKALELRGDSEGAIALGNIYAKGGFDKANRSLAEKELEQLKVKLERGEYVPAIRLARAYTTVEKNDEALAWLERAYEERNAFSLLIHADPFYDRLRTDARFPDLLQRFSLAGAEAATMFAGIPTATAESAVNTGADSGANETRPLQGQTALANSKATRYLLWSGLGILLLLAAGLVYWFYTNRHPPIESIAVLPFINASGNPEIEYLSDGMTDMLITSLSQVPNLSVKAHSSVFRYKNRDAQPQQVGKDLNVQAILNGRVVQRGNDLALHIELVDVRTETTLWVADYSRSISNLAAVQNEIARDVSQKLRTRLSGPEQQKVTRDYTANSEARDLYLRGRFHNLKLTPPEVQQGIAYFQQAIQHDPNYALAYVGLSEAYRGLTLSGELKPTEYMPRAKEAAQKALELDDALAEAHTAMGVTNFWYDWNYGAAESQFKRALELNANSADTHLFYAHLLSNTGRHQEALSEIKRARELDPYSPLLNALEGQFLIHAGKLDEALIRLRETFELAPGFWFPHVFASSAYMEKGMYAEAILEAKKASELSKAQTASIVFEGVALARMGRKDETRILLERLLKASKETSVPASHIAMLYHALGENDDTFKWLERGVEQRDPKMAFLKVQPRWNDLRGDPRFQEIMKRVGF
jgi:TolB-like protein/Flp pilus assembly protein TadD